MRRRVALLAAALLLSGFAGGLIVAGRLSGTTPAVAAPEPVEQARPAAGALPDLSAVAERAIRASVNISSTQYVQVDPWFQLFWGEDAIRPETSLGSGVIVSRDGYVLTNTHVVGSTRAEMRVTLPDNRELEAKIVAVDGPTDLAVIKVDAAGLEPLPWGDSSRLRVAEWVLAIGNPFSFNQTVTLGIVSAVNRQDPQLATYHDFIQTDAAINPGNSGGPLVNGRGELVGINTMIYSRTGGYQGIGFAVPANLARRVMDELVRTGEVRRGSIGLRTLRTIDPATAERAGLGPIRGALVYSLFRNGSAFRAGVQLNDIILRFNGRDVTGGDQLQRWIAEAEIGSLARLEVLRQGRRVTIAVPVERMRN